MCAEAEGLTACLPRVSRPQGNFSKTAALRMPPNTGFTTAVDKPRVHKDITP